MFTTITTSTANQHILTEDEATLLGQVIDIDGHDNVVLSTKPATNASGRTIGEHLIITDDAWAAATESLAVSDDE